MLCDGAAWNIGERRFVFLEFGQQFAPLWCNGCAQELYAPNVVESPTVFDGPVAYVIVLEVGQEDGEGRTKLLMEFLQIGLQCLIQACRSELRFF